MVEYLESNIKDLIRDNPPIGSLLDEYGIACVTCGVGTCRLEDIIEIHNLSADEEFEVLSKIADVLYPGQTVSIPRISRERKPASTSYSPPVKILVDEHVHIKKVVAFIPSLKAMLRDDAQRAFSLTKRAVEFIRNYADRFHHAKEEEILFGYFDTSVEIFQVMYRDHEKARGHVAAIVAGVEREDVEAVTENLEAYGELLNEHIRKEDEALYPWIDRYLTTAQVGELYTRFASVATEFGDEPAGYETFADELTVNS